MIILKKWQLRTLLLANVIALNAYGNLNAKNKTSETEKVQKVEKSSQTSSQGTSKVQTKLDKAKKKWQSCFCSCNRVCRHRKRQSNNNC